VSDIVTTKQSAHFLSATDAITEIRAGRLSARELVEACLKQIEKVDPHINAWAYRDSNISLSGAHAVDAALAEERDVGKLCGIPVGVKDIFNTQDFPTSMGSPIWKGFTPGNDARVVFYLKQAGGVILGKTVTAEFGVHTPGPTLNPHNLDHSPGTSSSGSAAAVAAAMVPVAIGTQTAGSTIRPASYCGILGMKPSFGLMPRTGMLKTTDSLDTIGYFARVVEDLELLFDIMRVHGKDYPYSHALLKDPARMDREGGRPWKVALVRGPKWNHAYDYAQTAIRSFAERLAGSKDVVVEETAIPEAFDEAHDIHATIYDKALAYYFQEEFKQHTLVSELMYDIISHGKAISLRDYHAALQRQADLHALLDDFFVRNDIDIILNLSTAGEAPRKNDNDISDNCLIWTLCGVPVINLPAFTSPSGLPFGAQVVARRYNDILLLSFTKDLYRAGIVSQPPLPQIAR
jgi:Asp-tRNA(Asn)/Glu-tRNA(Gln) amidotransferase A subunit family amidase